MESWGVAALAITKIKVENVKGAKCIEIDDKILPNKPSLMVAPNGFGKTSITVAFLSLNANRLKLEDEYAHLGNPSNKPRLTIDLLRDGGHTDQLYADEGANTIAAQLDVHVINSRLRPKAIKRNMGKFTTASARMVLDEIVLVPKIPARVGFGYSAATIRRDFGPNGKCLPNIDEDLRRPLLSTHLLASRGIITKFSGARVSAVIDGIKGRINQYPGSATAVLELITAELESDLDGIECLTTVADLLDGASPKKRSRTELLLGALQICELSKRDTAAFKAACEYAEYLGQKDAYAHLITSFNTAWKSVKPTEKSGQLVVDFPDPSMVSNGQRDALSFAAQIQRVRQKLGKRDLVLIIDEIFDYLDDANLVAAQYYISNLIKEVKGRGLRIYPLIFTHLDPQSFRNYAFQDQKIYYLSKSKATVSKNFRNLIQKREDPGIKMELDRHFLHFAPGDCDISAQFKALGLVESWGDSKRFAAHLAGEWSKYHQGLETYDPFAVCCYVRVAIEKSAYDRINDSAKAACFIDTNGTSKKLQYAKSLGVDVPEVSFLLGVIYNEGMHYRAHIDNASPIVSRLENVVIRRMLEEAVRV